MLRDALILTLQLALCTTLVLLPVGLWLGRWLAWSPSRLRVWLEAGVMLPLVLPPTVLGYYLLIGMGKQSWLGSVYLNLTGKTLVFGFAGLLLASLVFNLPFAVQPMQRAFAAIPHEVREAGWCCGLSGWQSFWRIEWPLAWPGILSALALTFAHTLGEFGVVLMVGGNIPGETQTLALVIYDRVQAFDLAGAHRLSLGLLALSFVCLASVYLLGGPRRTALRV
ncbi:MAG: molybdate ABC transporter permease subunit [Candidatus Sericytochromatia bacterium]